MYTLSVVCNQGNPPSALSRAGAVAPRRGCGCFVPSGADKARYAERKRKRRAGRRWRNSSGDSPHGNAHHSRTLQMAAQYMFPKSAHNLVFSFTLHPALPSLTHSSHQL
ncbi:hypothetical protein NX059_004410 [Plenodomus lindquistii]|nr:hypothetical protein NX059_004410 [Plenodomus lindquistii]